MRRNLAAYTECGPAYPQYVSINEEDDTTVSITVRSPAVDGREGATAVARFSRPEFRDFLRATLERVLEVVV